MKSVNFFLLCITLMFSTTVLFGADLEDLSYSIKYDSVTITDCKTTASGALEIPNTISGYPVTRIGNAAFRSCSNLTSVLLPDGIVSIGDVVIHLINKIKEENKNLKDYINSY